MSLPSVFYKKLFPSTLALLALTFISLIPLIALIALTALIALAKPLTVQAVCPLCTVAVAGGLGISRLIGIDDSVVGVWIGGLIISSGLWLADWASNKRFKIPFAKVSLTGLFALLVLVPLAWMQIIGTPTNTLWGIDKILLGSGVGVLAFLLGVWMDKWLRTFNNGKVFIYYQKVIVPIFILTVSSFILYLITS